MDVTKQQYVEGYLEYFEYDLNKPSPSTESVFVGEEEKVVENEDN